MSDRYPSWLKNPSKERLELDAYNEEGPRHPKPEFYYTVIHNIRGETIREAKCTSCTPRRGSSIRSENVGLSTQVHRSRFLLLLVSVLVLLSLRVLYDKR